MAVILAIPPVRFATTRTTFDVDRTTPAWKTREALIARAHVFVPDPPDPSSIDFGRTLDEVRCRFAPAPTSGTTSKFDCTLESGEKIKVKYGWSPERQGEVAATRLLSALGFGADRVSMAKRVICEGCPPWPFEMRLLAEQFLLGRLLDRAAALDRITVFEWVSVEHRIPAREIEADGFEGWDWRELALVDPARGGAPKADLDALRLMAVLLAHWDNKASNQRLVCAGNSGQTKDPAAPCEYPLLMLHDVGATFGPGKVDLQAWAAYPIWADPPSCLVSMARLPYEGVLFEPVRISEAGRLQLARRLRKLSESQAYELFRGAQFPDPVSGKSPASDLTPWVRAFHQKVRDIVDRPPCPSAP